MPVNFDVSFIVKHSSESIQDRFSIAEPQMVI